MDLEVPLVSEDRTEVDSLSPYPFSYFYTALFCGVLAHFWWTLESLLPLCLIVSSVSSLFSIWVFSSLPQQFFFVSSSPISSPIFLMFLKVQLYEPLYLCRFFSISPPRSWQTWWDFLASFPPWHWTLVSISSTRNEGCVEMISLKCDLCCMGVVGVSLGINDLKTLKYILYEQKTDRWTSLQMGFLSWCQS